MLHESGADDAEKWHGYMTLAVSRPVQDGGMASCDAHSSMVPLAIRGAVNRGCGAVRPLGWTGVCADVLRHETRMRANI